MTEDAGGGSRIDVAAALRELKAEVRRQRHELRGERAIAAENALGSANLEAVQNTARVNPHLPIAWPEWPPGIVPKIAAGLQKIVRRLLRWYINPIVEQQNEFNAATARALTELAVELRAGDARLERRLEDLRAALAQERESQERDRAIVSQRLWRVEQRTEPERTQRDGRATDERESRPADTLATPRTAALDYYHFELRHRGSPEEIAARQRLYLADFQGCRQVLDIGCGRGEFVALLREHGVDARGVDIDPEMVAHCRAKGLPVEQADALSYVAGLPDSALDGVFMAQVVEHLPPADLVHLLRLCRQKLAPAGVLVAETINPACVYALVQYYLMDPSHIQPLHPETLRFMLEDAGFWQVEVRYLSLVPADQRLSPVAPDTLSEAQVSILNRNVERLNALLFGYQDYAAVARRPPRDLPDAG